MSKKLTQEDFIRRSKVAHGDKYDYSLVEYKGTKEKVAIICPIHGLFMQVPDSHMKGIGCPLCGQIKASNKLKLTAEQFISKAREIHGDIYDYSKVDYIDSSTKVCIICPKHGEFWQIPNSHLNGSGCVKCSYVVRGQNKSITTEEFIRRAKEIHGNKYDYSKVDCKNSSTKVCIICPTHGEFWQAPSGHIYAKQGCQKCYNDRRRKIVLGFGINDSELPITHGGGLDIPYKIWTSMIRRCYSDKYHKHKPSYIGCSVCEEWKYFSNFLKFFNENYKEGYVLDKDIIIQGNKVYSPETCCFVPPYINGLILTNETKRGKLKTGVYLDGDKYVAQCGINRKQQCVGRFNSEDEAHESYKKAKYSEIKRVANEALRTGEINEAVHDALLRFEIKEY